MSYYDHNGASTKEAMFIYLRNMVAAGKTNVSLKILDDLVEAEFNGERLDWVLPLELDAKASPYVQAKTLIKDANAWVEGIDANNTKTKFPREDAVTLFQSIPLTLDDLDKLRRDLRGNVYMGRLLFSHPGFTEKYVRDNLMMHQFSQFVSGTRNGPLLRKIITEIIPHTNSWGNYRASTLLAGLGDGTHLDAETVKLLVDNGCYQFVSHPLFPYESVRALVLEKQGTNFPSMSMFYHQVLKNPNLEDDLREIIFMDFMTTPNTLSNYGWYVAKWDKAPSFLLDAVFEETRSQHGVRALLAAHPNTSLRVLRKLGQSTVPSVKGPALAQLKVKDKHFKE